MGEGFLSDTSSARTKLTKKRVTGKSYVSKQQMLQQRYSYSGAVRVVSVLYGYHVTHSVSQIHYSMYKMYEHAQSVEYSIIIRVCVEVRD